MTVETMLKRHDAGDYYIHHWTGFIKSSVTAKQSGRKIANRMNDTLRRIAKEGDVPEGFVLMAHMAKRFIADLEELAPAEFEKLQNLYDEDLMNRVPYQPDDPFLADKWREFNKPI